MHNSQLSHDVLNVLIVIGLFCVLFKNPIYAIYLEFA